MALVVSAQKYRNIWAASCSCLFWKAKQKECEINLYQQDENIYREAKYRMGKSLLILEGRACEGAGLHLGGLCCTDVVPHSQHTRKM